MNQRLIENWMTKNNRTPTAMAAHFNVHPTTFWRRISGKVKAPYSFIGALARMMDVDPVKLLRKDSK